jgi:hypothetical protein
MTSRSGKEGLHRRNDTATLRFLDYLKSLNGLALGVHSADASSEEDMRRTLRLYPSVAGCMLMSGLLVDGTFQHQSEESFFATFPSKTGAFNVVEELLDIESMDWLIGFSSISALFGNAGQTNYARRGFSAATFAVHSHKAQRELHTAGAYSKIPQFILAGMLSYCQRSRVYAADSNGI